MQSDGFIVLTRAEIRRLDGELAQAKAEIARLLDGIVCLGATKRHLVKEFGRVAGELAQAKADGEKFKTPVPPDALCNAACPECWGLKSSAESAVKALAVSVSHASALEQHISSLKDMRSIDNGCLVACRQGIDLLEHELKIWRDGAGETVSLRQRVYTTEKALADQRSEYDGAMSKVEEWLDALQRETGKVADGSLTLVQAVDEQLRILADRSRVEVCPVEDMKKLEKALAGMTEQRDNHLREASRLAIALAEEREKRIAAEAQASGQCDGCGEELDDAYCTKCYERHAEAEAKRLQIELDKQTFRSESMTRSATEYADEAKRWEQAFQAETLARDADIRRLTDEAKRAREDVLHEVRMATLESKTLKDLCDWLAERMSQEKP